MSYKVQCIFFIISFINIINCNIQCKDENNNDVDWFIMYKIPKNATNTNKFVKEGLGYTFITSAHSTGSWSVSDVSVNDSTSILGFTLNPLYNGELNSSYFVYNDQPPEGTASDENGHSKGVLFVDHDSGFWLIHSIPLFPPAYGSTYSYPKTGTHFGQNILCVSLSLPNVDAVASQLMYIRPYPYSSFISEHTSLINLAKLVNHEYINTAPFWKEKPITTLDGTVFRSFAKTSKFHKDLYVDWLAQALQDHLLVETWPNGPGRLPSNCSLPYKVNNVAKVNIKVINSTFTDHVDHSKWAVTSNKPWTCIGGVNRAEHQEQRGGGTLCVHSLKIWESYKKSIVEIEPCSTSNY